MFEKKFHLSRWSRYHINLRRKRRKHPKKTLWSKRSFETSIETQYTICKFCMIHSVMQWIDLKAVKTAICFLSCVERQWCCLKYISMLFLRVFLFCWEIKVVKMQRPSDSRPWHHARGFNELVMQSLVLSCLSKKSSRSQCRCNGKETFIFVENLNISVLSRLN